MSGSKNHPKSVPSEMWESLDIGASEAEIIATKSLTYWQDVRARLWQNKPAVVSIVFIVGLILSAIFGPMISPYTFFEQDLKLSNIPPVFQTYQVGDSKEDQTRFFLNSGNFKLYEVSESGKIVGLIRGGAA